MPGPGSGHGFGHREYGPARESDATAAPPCHTAAARQALDEGAFRAKVAEALQRFVPKVTGGTAAAQTARDACLSRFLDRLTYFSLDVNDGAQFQALKKSLDEAMAVDYPKEQMKDAVES